MADPEAVAPQSTEIPSVPRIPWRITSLSGIIAYCTLFSIAKSWARGLFFRTRPPTDGMSSLIV